MYNSTTTQTSDFTAQLNYIYNVDTSASEIVCTFPPPETVYSGACIQITNDNGSLAINKLTIDPNGGKIDLQTKNYECNIPNYTWIFTYDNVNETWRDESNVNVHVHTITNQDFTVDQFTQVILNNSPQIANIMLPSPVPPLTNKLIFVKNSSTYDLILVGTINNLVQSQYIIRPNEQKFIFSTRDTWCV